MYAITAQINRTGVDKSKAFPEGWESSRQVPTFYLDERVQGIMSAAHAEDIARSILLPWGSPPDMTAAITAVRVSGEDNFDPTEIANFTEGARDAHATRNGGDADDEVMGLNRAVAAAALLLGVDLAALQAEVEAAWVEDGDDDA